MLWWGVGLMDLVALGNEDMFHYPEPKPDRERLRTKAQRRRRARNETQQQQSTTVVTTCPHHGKNTPPPRRIRPLDRWHLVPTAYTDDDECSCGGKLTPAEQMALGLPADDDDDQ